MLEMLGEDLARYRQTGARVRRIALRMGYWAVVEYRFGHWVRVEAPRRISLILRPIAVMTHLLIQISAGIDIQPRAKIGPGLHIAHFGGIFINEDVVIGRDFGISQGVTIGNGAGGGTPRIGDRVDVYPGAKIFGGITIGNDVDIGANAVVNTDLPDGVLAVGVPARAVPRRRPAAQP